ncbi:MAG TPA: biotin--[acetyl-CoA-carboxylase] ligase [Anaerolineae bacterium]|nr:biotin--[acetyl-CoA-carboxylase] ligase [Anaerolineae bacterium]HIQ12141.1 biotin--[acetyl-CoA-carboxylase] ligase [Caldilineales bacterium]
MIDFTVITLRSVTSTQAWVADWAAMDAREGLALIAREQTAGRGRLDRRWESPPGGLYLSLLLRPGIPLAQANQLTMLVSLAAIDACQRVADVRPRPKWPNDLLAEGKKLAGVLTELVSERDRLRYAIIGLGLNVNKDFDGGPLASTATSLRQLTGRELDIGRVADAFLQALARRYDGFRAGISPHAEWARRLEPLGRRVEVERSGQPRLVGRAVGVTPEGALRVLDDAGGEHVIWAGDVRRSGFER